jgi:hypothetical protein
MFTVSSLLIDSYYLRDRMRIVVTGGTEYMRTFSPFHSKWFEIRYIAFEFESKVHSIETNSMCYIK